MAAAFSCGAIGIDPRMHGDYIRATLRSVATIVLTKLRRHMKNHDFRAQLHWLPCCEHWSQQIKDIENEEDDARAWLLFVALANTQLDFVQLNRVDRMLARRFGTNPPAGLATVPVRLAVVGSSTLGHLFPAIRLAGLRRGLWVTIYEGEYGQYVHELADPASDLYDFKPTAVLIALDAYHATRGLGASSSLAEADQAVDEMIDTLAGCWRSARHAKIDIIQQTILPSLPAVLGANEHRLPGSRARMVRKLNNRLREAADAEGVDLLAVDTVAADKGIRTWHDPTLWLRAKQDVSPLVSPTYGDLVGRLLAARQGRSFKCLVLDLDNTLWGGVIGDDGLDGIVIGQGSAMGEAFLDLQSYALALAKRGIILAVCSKNDEDNALAPFERHPDMLLRRSDIACFVANWDDKPSNIRRISQELNIGVDSIVFVDDNPFERNLVRAELPMVAVPEISEDPAFVVQAIADAGYFEGVTVTEEDRERTEQYQANAQRAKLHEQATDLSSYLASLEMQLSWKHFDDLGLSRITQLINKTNQFNLTTRRYSEEQVRALIGDANAVTLQLRLRDRFGDNGIIGILIGKLDGEDLVIDTWLMSCRVLKRRVEEASLLLLAEAARAKGAKRLIGDYIPTAKNGMVKDHYPRLGFGELESDAGGTRWAVALDDVRVEDVPMIFVKEL